MIAVRRPPGRPWWSAACVPPSGRQGRRPARRPRSRAGVGHRSTRRGRDERGRARRPTAFTASKVITAASGMTTKKATSSRGSPATRHGNVWRGRSASGPARVARGPRRGTAPRRQDGAGQPHQLAQHAQAVDGDQRQRPRQAEDRASRRRTSCGQVHRAPRRCRRSGARSRPARGRLGEGPVDRSPRMALSSTSALIRHIGRPIPGRVLWPA